jgi:hypothetical protein
MKPTKFLLMVLCTTFSVSAAYMRISLYFSFIIANLRRLWSFSHAAAIALYCSVAWFLVEIEPTMIVRTELVFAQYGFLLQTFALLTCILTIIQHWKEELQAARRDIMRLRLGNAGMVIGLFASYWIFWITASALPMMLTAAVQQTLGGSGYFTFSAALESTLSALFTGFAPLWIAASLSVFTSRRNEPLTVFVIALMIVAAFIVRQATSGIVFDELWIAHPTVWSAIAWCCSLVIIARILRRFWRSLDSLTMTTTFSHGLTVRALQHLGWSLSAFHARLMNMSHALVLAVFSGLGLVIIIPLVQRSPSFAVLANVYLGALVPLLFALRTRFVIDVDAHAHISDVVRLRPQAYWRVVLNRWCVLLIPMTITTMCLGTVLWASTPHGYYAPYNVMYCSLLGIIWQSMALALALLSRQFLRWESNSWQVALLLLVYIQLRDDVQTVMTTSFLSVINIVSPLQHPTFSPNGFDYGRLFCFFVVSMGISVFCLFVLVSSNKRSVG